MSDKTEQVVLQLKAVAHMARALADVSEAQIEVYRNRSFPEGVEWKGKSTAYQMEILGDILNGMDAVDEEEDAWLTPVFEEAQRLWPQEQTP